MGKWTLEHHDEVLRNKVKSLVQGAIKRMEVEQDAHTITYEAFVEELDEGDSFTTSLVDVLVKELAERRTRPNPPDRRLISERTAKSLRMQSAPLHIYRDRHQSTARERVRRYTSIPRPRSRNSRYDFIFDSDGDEDYGNIIGSGSLEGTHMNTSLFDAYSTSVHDSVSNSADGTTELIHPHESLSTGSWLFDNPLPTSSSSAWTGLRGPASSSLSRQSTIRRSLSSRAAESNEFASFTSRRRSALRSLTTAMAEDESPTDTSVATGSSTTDTARPARAFDLTAWMANRRAGSSSFNSISNAGDAPSGTTTIERPSSSQMWYSMTAANSTSQESMPVSAFPRRSSTSDLNDARRQSIAPRLRRGGLRPPESLLLEGPASPAVEGVFNPILDAVPRNTHQDISYPEDAESAEQPATEAQHSPTSRQSPAPETV